MKKIIPVFAILFFILPSVSSAAALTEQQANSLIAIVQSSPGTPASAFVSLITAFSNITTAQASSLITVVQSAPGVPANSFVNLLTSFTVDTSTTPAVITPTPTQTTQTNNQNTSPGSTETVSQINAVAKAKSYLDYSAFSHDGLVAQLEYEQFSPADAVYGADNSGANWNEQAAAKAKSYMSYSAFSRGSLITQLEYEKFTQAQAEYGADAVGLSQ